jgi:putative two-component system response regulator
MQSHATIGGDIIGKHQHGMLAMAYDVAVTHHEKWDGSGYPNGLKAKRSRWSAASSRLPTCSTR